MSDATAPRPASTYRLQVRASFDLDAAATVTDYLRDLGVASIVNLASSPRSFVGLSGFGIEIAETQPLE